MNGMLPLRGKPYIIINKLFSVFGASKLPEDSHGLESER